LDRFETVNRTYGSAEMSALVGDIAVFERARVICHTQCDGPERSCRIPESPVVTAQSGVKARTIDDHTEDLSDKLAALRRAPIPAVKSLEAPVFDE
jgi:hypothetical protein